MINIYCLVIIRILLQDSPPSRLLPVAGSGRNIETSVVRGKPSYIDRREVAQRRPRFLQDSYRLGAQLNSIGSERGKRNDPRLWYELEFKYSKPRSGVSGVTRGKAGWKNNRILYLGRPCSVRR